MTRVLSGVALAASAFALVWWLPTTALLAVALVMALLSYLEYARLVRAIGADLPFVPALLATLTACVSVALPWVHVPSLLGVLLLVVALSLMLGGSHGAPLMHGASAAMLAPVYLGLPIGALIGIHATAGREGLLVLIATVTASDSAQYYSGRTFGRRPLAPTISPNKTIEGAFGGLIVAPLVLWLLARTWLPQLAPAAAVGAGVGIVVAGIAGDLFESALKRAAGVKDSGALIPGHGGVLDRIDALLFAAPLFYLVVRAA